MQDAAALLLEHAGQQHWLHAGTDLAEAREIALHAVAGTLDLSVDSYLPSPRLLAQTLGREPPEHATG